MTKNKIELLAPAGSMESLKAAVQSGADAIYLGGNKFSARAYASNFDNETMKEAIEYCHFYGVKVYVTINTLLKEEEIMEALEYANFLNNISVDAVIIQDLGLASLIKRHISDLEIHASTQMTIHNGEGAKFLNEYGFKRIVLSRELSVEEIKYISTDLQIETEIFVHGALCICYSGQCLMSSIIGGRSGNRGKCAQPCRLPYKLINKRTNESKDGYIMSPKDICTLDNIGEIIESGTSSLKIEGRMKRPEYVAGVVSSYRKAIDNYYNNRQEELKEEKKMVAQLFNREGFSRAYLFGNDGKDMMSINFPKNTGVYLGEVTKDRSIILNEDLSVKDGVRIDKEGFIITSIIKDNNEVTHALKGERVFIKPMKFKGGDILYKTSDNELLDKLSAYYKENHRVYDLDIRVKFKINEEIELKCTLFNKEFSIKGDMVQEALKKPLDKDNIIKNLRKTGNTAFSIDSIEFLYYEEGFIPVSSLNKVRRELIEMIQNFIKKKSNKIKDNKIDVEKIIMENKSCQHREKHDFMPKLLITITTNDQLEAVCESNNEYICINPFYKGNRIDIKTIKNKKVYLRVPNIIKDTEWDKCCTIIDNHLNNIEGILTSNIGIMGKYKDKIDIIADYKSNIFNAYATDINMAIQGGYISPELNKKEIKELCSSLKDTSSLGMMIYGRYELMVSEYCPIGAFYGGNDSKTSCNGACTKGKYYLKDRKEEEFPVITDIFCRSYILNGAITNLLSQRKEIYGMGITNFRVDFTDEDYEATKMILDNINGEIKDIPQLNYTKGHYKRGVE